MEPLPQSAQPAQTIETSLSADSFNVRIQDGLLTLNTGAEKVKRYRVVLNSGVERREITDATQLQGVINALKLISDPEIKDLSKITLKQDGIETDDPSTVDDRTAAVAKRTLIPFDDQAKLKYHEAIDYVFKNAVRQATAESNDLEDGRVSANPPPSSSKPARVAQGLFSSIGNFFRRIGSGIEAGAKWVWSHTIGGIIQWSKDRSEVKKEQIKMDNFKKKVEENWVVDNEEEFKAWMIQHKDKLDNLDALDVGNNPEILDWIDASIITKLNRLYDITDDETSAPVADSDSEDADVLSDVDIDLEEEV